MPLLNGDVGALVCMRCSCLLAAQKEQEPSRLCAFHSPLLQLPSETEHPSEQRQYEGERAAVVLGVLEGVRELL